MNQVWRWPLAMVTGFLSLGGLCMLFAYFQEDENADAPTTIRLIEASLRREDVADRTNFRLLLCALLPISSPVLAKKRTPQLSVHVLSNTSTRNAYNLETIPLALILLSKSMFYGNPALFNYENFILYLYHCFSENRYLLILTENYAALGMIQQHLLKTSEDAVVIFGSSFLNDQEYTQVKQTALMYFRLCGCVVSSDHTLNWRINNHCEVKDFSFQYFVELGPHQSFSHWQMTPMPKTLASLHLSQFAISTPKNQKGYIYIRLLHHI